MKHERKGFCPFIKYVPVADRPQYILEHLRAANRKAFCSDYVSFEALFTKVQLKIECDMIMHMIQYWPESMQTFYKRFLVEIICGTNVCRILSMFVVSLKATRMSGEMSTSLGNGWFNLMSQLFIFKKVLRVKDVRCVVEGDDSLTTHGSNTDVGPTESMYESLGLKVELEVHQDVSEASFCGIVFDVIDGVNVTDVREALATFGWVSARYARSKSSKLRALLRCKSLSYLHQYPGCPVIQEMALYGLRVTAGVDLRWATSSRHMSMWERDQLCAAVEAFRDVSLLVAREVPFRTRLLVEKLYGISVEQQYFIEKWFQNQHVLLHYNFEANYPASWLDYADRYVLPSCSEETGWLPRRRIQRPQMVVKAFEPWVDLTT